MRRAIEGLGHHKKLCAAAALRTLRARQRFQRLRRLRRWALLRRGQFREALEHHKKHLEIAVEIAVGRGARTGEDGGEGRGRGGRQL